MHRALKHCIIALCLIILGVTFPVFAVEYYTYSTIDFPGSKETRAYGINNSGNIVGFYYDGKSSHGFLYKNGEFTTIEPQGSKQSAAHGINNSGNIVGFYHDGKSGHGFLYKNGNYITIDFPGAKTTVADGINDNGQIVGYYYNENSNKRGFLYDSGVFTTIYFNSSLSTTALGINNNGKVVGNYDYKGRSTEYGFLYESGNFSTITYFTYGFVKGINNDDLIVGWYHDYSSKVATDYGFVRYKNGKWSSFFLTGARHIMANDVNDNGQIVGSYYVSSSGKNYGYLATLPSSNQTPVASFTNSPANPAVGEQVTFDASASSDSDGTISKYEWDFGDGSTSTGKTAYHSYSAAGTYTVKLTVTDNNNLTNSTQKTVTVTSANQSPVAAFTYSPENPKAGEKVTFDASSSSDSDGTIEGYEWDFGNKSTG